MHLFRRIEQWASQSADRTNLLVLLVVVALCITVAGVIAIAALVMLPPDPPLP